MPWALHWKARIALDRGDVETARNSLVESVNIFQLNEDRGGQIRSLLAFAWLHSLQGDYTTSIALLAAEEAQRQQDASPPPPDWEHDIEPIKTAARKLLGDLQFNGICAEGQRLSLAEAVELALKPTS